MNIPFLRPNLPAADAYLPLLREMDAHGQYSNFGPLNQRFEQRLLADIFAGRGQLTTISNCTLGLMLAIEAVKRPAARYAVMPSFTFAATPLAAQWCGLEPYFVDIDADRWAVDDEGLAAAIAELGDEVAVVVPYATFGLPIELAPYQRLIDQGIPVVVDAAPGLGARTAAGKPFGADFTGAVVFSCHATKPFGIGEGGVIYSADPALIERIRRGSNFGFDTQRLSVAPGLNAKLPEAMAAVGLVVADLYEGKLTALERLHQCYVDELAAAGLVDSGWQVQPTVGVVPRQFFPVLVPLAASPADFMSALSSRFGIETRAYFRPPCHRQPQFAACRHGGLTVTDAVSDRVICLPLWHGMTDQTVGEIVAGLARLVR